MLLSFLVVSLSGFTGVTTGEIVITGEIELLQVRLSQSPQGRSQIFFAGLLETIHFTQLTTETIFMYK